MEKHEKITKWDLKFRPKTYWGHPSPLKVILSGISSPKRRALITEYYNAGRLDQLDDELLKDVLNEDVRKALGQIDPSFMGGEYLPSLPDDDAIVASLHLASVTGDVIQLRARRQTTKRGALLSVTLYWVDEYGDFGEFADEDDLEREDEEDTEDQSDPVATEKKTERPPPRFEPSSEWFSRIPTMGEVITFICSTSENDYGRLPFCYHDDNHYNGCVPWKDLRGFGRIHSSHYPKLGLWYDLEEAEYIRDREEE